MLLTYHNPRREGDIIYGSILIRRGEVETSDSLDILTFQAVCPDFSQASPATRCVHKIGTFVHGRGNSNLAPRAIPNDFMRDDTVNYDIRGRIRNRDSAAIGAIGQGEEMRFSVVVGIQSTCDRISFIK